MATPQSCPRLKRRLIIPQIFTVDLKYVSENFSIILCPIYGHLRSVQMAGGHKKYTVKMVE